MLRHLKFKPLLIFDRVLQRNSILHAARELHLTQSAVTKAVRELEDQLGVQLFERSNRGVTPTDYGQMLGARVKSVIAEVRYLADELNAFRGAESGHVIVGTLIAGSARLLPLAIGRLKTYSPQVLVTVREGSTDRLYPSLATGELDLMVGRLPEHEHPITQTYPIAHEVLFTESFSLVVRAGHPLTLKPALSLVDTMDWPWVLPVPESPSRWAADQLFHIAGLSLPSNRVESLSLMTNVNLLIESDACVLMPRSAAELFIRAGILHALPMKDVGRFGDVGVSVRANKLPTPAAQLFIKCLREVAKEFAL
jgi:DNA-binding transcriptional LysR family regulator